LFSWRFIVERLVFIFIQGTWALFSYCTILESYLHTVHSTLYCRILNSCLHTVYSTLYCRILKSCLQTVYSILYYRLQIGYSTMYFRVPEVFFYMQSTVHTTQCIQYHLKGLFHLVYSSVLPYIVRMCTRTVQSALII